MNRGARMTPEALAAQGIVQGPDGHWRKATIAAPVPLALPEPLPKARKWYPYRNKTEHDAAGILARLHPELRWRYESLVVWLPGTDGRHSDYRPDFPGWDGATVRKVVEVKGGHRWRRGGVDRLRAAVAARPEIEWYLMEKNNGEWSIKRVEGTYRKDGDEWANHPHITTAFGPLPTVAP